MVSNISSLKSISDYLDKYAYGYNNAKKISDISLATGYSGRIIRSAIDTLIVEEGKPYCFISAKQVGYFIPILPDEYSYFLHAINDISSRIKVLSKRENALKNTLFNYYRRNYDL
jgi:hypothetical protein